MLPYLRDRLGSHRIERLQAAYQRIQEEQAKLTLPRDWVDVSAMEAQVQLPAVRRTSGGEGVPDVDMAAAPQVPRVSHHQRQASLAPSDPLAEFMDDAAAPGGEVGDPATNWQHPGPQDDPVAHAADSSAAFTFRPEGQGPPVAAEPPRSSRGVGHDALQEQFHLLNKEYERISDPLKQK